MNDSVKQPETLLQQIYVMRDKFECTDGIITGKCVLCATELSLSWFDWRQHLLNHTEEERFYCSECDTHLSEREDHVECSASSIIDVYGDLDVGSALEGFICKRCDYLQINDYRLLKHCEEKQNEACALYESNVIRVLLVPDVRPQQNPIQTKCALVQEDERYRCGAGNCAFHGKNASQYIEHLNKAHSIFKTFFCPHCKKLIHRLKEPTVSLQRVLNHIDMHGPFLYQCDYCPSIESSEQAICTHLTNEHADSALKFWRNQRKSDGSETNDAIEVILECSLCQERIADVTSAIDHYKVDHSDNVQVNFNTRKFIKTTKSDLNVICSTERSPLCYSELLACDFCDAHFFDKHEWCCHFASSHPTESLLAKRDFKWLDTSEEVAMHENTFDKHMLYFCAFCEDSSGKKLKASSEIDDIYKHWKHEHSHNDFKSFKYLVAELVACYYCNTIATFQELKDHVEEKHPNKTFVAIKAFRSTKECALCEFGGEDLVKHTKREHALAMQSNVFNPVPLNALNLWKLHRICIYQKYKCKYCDLVFDTRSEYRDHHTDEHLALELNYEKFFDTESVRLIGGCCGKPVDLRSFFDHLANFKHEIQCEECQFEATDAFEFVCHQVNSHQAAKGVKSMYEQFLRLRYWRSEMIFGNGLALNKFNTIKTEFDYTDRFETFLARLVKLKLKPYGFQQSDDETADLDE